MIKLILLGEELLAALVKDPAGALDGFASNGGLVAQAANRVARATLTLQSKTGARPPWVAYLALRDGDYAAVGACAFKGPPVDRAVEIVCYTFPGFERRGYGGAMASQLIDIAFVDRQVSEVVAHTEPVESAATRILRRRGFTFGGEAEDGADDAACRWTLRRTGCAR